MNAFVGFFNRISRTVIAAWIPAAVGFLATIGIDLPLDLITQAAEKIVTLSNGVFDTTAELWMLIVPPIVVWFRTITTSPVVGGLLGWLGFRAKLPNVVGKTPREAHDLVHAAGLTLGSIEHVDVVGGKTKHGTVLDAEQIDGVAILRVARVDEGAKAT